MLLKYPQKNIFWRLTTNLIILFSNSLLTALQCGIFLVFGEHKAVRIYYKVNYLFNTQPWPLSANCQKLLRELKTGLN